MNYYFLYQHYGVCCVFVVVVGPHSITQYLSRYTRNPQVVVSSPPTFLLTRQRQSVHPLLLVQKVFATSSREWRESGEAGKNVVDLFIACRPFTSVSHNAKEERAVGVLHYNL